MNAIKVVPEGMNYTIERYGRYLKTLGPGQHILIPFVDRIGYRINMRERKLPVTFHELVTKDNQDVHTSAEIMVKVTNPELVAYQTGNVDDTIKLNLNKFMKFVVRSKTLSQLLSATDTIDDELLSRLKSVQQDWGVEVNFIDLHKFKVY